MKSLKQYSKYTYSSKVFNIDAAPLSLMLNHVVPTIRLMTQMEIETKVEICFTVDDLVQFRGFACPCFYVLIASEI